MTDRKKAYLFDMDGTLIDSEPIWEESFVYAMSLKGIDTTIEDFEALGFGHSWEDLFKAIKDKWPEGYQTREEIQKITEPYYYDVCGRRDITMPGARELIHRLGKAGHRIAIVSGSTTAQITRAIKMLKAEDHIRKYVSCDDVSKGKPSPDGYLKGAELLQVPPEDCIVVEDKAIGLQAALAAGMQCVVLQRPDQPPQNLTGAAAVISSLFDFPACEDQ